jgi:hypothetical protein
VLDGAIAVERRCAFDILAALADAGFAISR